MGDESFNHEDVTVYGLDGPAEEALLTTQRECTFNWTNKQGWPVGVVMSYIWRDGRFWLTASSQRLRVPAVRRDPRVSIVVSSLGTSLPSGQTVTYKGLCTVHEDRKTKDWFYDEFVRVQHKDESAAYQEYYVRVLDSPQRVVLEVTPSQRIGYDGTKMRAATRHAFSEDRRASSASS